MPSTRRAWQPATIPEVSVPISLTGIPRGAILQDGLGNNLYTIPASGSATVTIRLSDATNLIASPGQRP